MNGDSRRAVGGVVGIQAGRQGGRGEGREGGRESERGGFRQLAADRARPLRFGSARLQGNVVAARVVKRTFRAAR